jgi:hypothetical protein
MVAFDTVRPIKAIFQNDGEVILGEFTDQDLIGIDMGGTGASNSATARSNLQLIHYREFPTFSDFDTLPESGKLAKNSADGKLYYSHQNAWLQIGQSQLVSGTDNSGVFVDETEVEKFIFTGRIVYSYDGPTKTATLTVDVDDIEDRLDILEDDDQTSGSVRYLIKQRFDQLLDGVIPELDTLKEIADSLGDTLDFRNDFDNHVLDFNQLDTDFTTFKQDITNFDNVDLTTNAPIQGDAIIWDPTTSKWIPGASFNSSDFEAAFQTKTAADLDVGNASDGSFSDGALVIESDRKTADVIDDLNEALDNIRKGVYVKSVSFSANPTFGGQGTYVTLNLTVDGTANRYDIDWGDGSNTNNTTDSTPSHTYTSNANSPYTVTVRAYNSSGSGAGSEASSTIEDYIIIYTTDPAAAFRLYRNATGGSELSGNNLYVIEGDSLYLENISTQTTMADVEYTMDWGDGTAVENITSDNADGGVTGNRLQHTWGFGTHTGSGRDTLRLTLSSHSTANPNVIPKQTTKSLKVYDINPSAPQGLSSKSISFSGNTGSSPLLASGFTDNTTGTTYSIGSSVQRTTSTSGNISSTSISSFAYNADSGTLTALVNGVDNGNKVLDSNNNSGTYTSLKIDSESDYNGLNSSGSYSNFNNSIYYPNLYKGFKAKIQKSAAAVPVGVNRYQLSHSGTGNTNSIEFVKDNLTSTPTLTAGTISEKTGFYKYISGIPYYTYNSKLTWSDISVSNLVGQTYRNTSQVLYVTGSNNYEGTSSQSINNKSFNYSAIDGTTTMLQSGYPLVNTGVGTPYAIGDLEIDITNSGVRTIESIRAVAYNVNGTGSYVNNNQKIAVHTSSQSGISELSIPVSSSLGSGYNDSGKRIFDFASEITDTPTYNNTINFYTNNLYSESSDPGVSGTQEATVRLGVLKHSLDDYSGFLPVGPDRSGDSGVQYFTFAFRRTITANFNINISSSGVSGVWIAAPGTTIDTASSLNGWLDCSVQYAGAGVPGESTSGGGNGSNGCASTGGDRIQSNTSLSGSYTMTLGTENLTNATNNVALVRIALNSGQSVNSISIT